MKLTWQQRVRDSLCASIQGLKRQFILSETARARLRRPRGQFIMQRKRMAAVDTFNCAPLTWEVQLLSCGRVGNWKKCTSVRRERCVDGREFVYGGAAKGPTPAITKHQHHERKSKQKGTKLTCEQTLNRQIARGLPWQAQSHRGAG